MELACSFTLMYTIVHARFILLIISLGLNRKNH